LPWAIYEEGAYRHPTMVYELLYLYFASYALFRFWLEFIRVYPVVALGLTGAQYLCLGILAGLGVYLLKRGSAVSLPSERIA
jgi:prolipoprotein diacylglyceryltransferase